MHCEVSLEGVMPLPTNSTAFDECAVDAHRYYSVPVFAGAVLVVDGGHVLVM